MDKCYFKKKIRERIFNAETGRWTTSWIHVPSLTNTTGSRSSSTSTRRLGPLCQPRIKPRPFKLVQIRNETIYTDPVTQQRSIQVEHQNVKIYTEDEGPGQIRNQFSTSYASANLPDTFEHEAQVAPAKKDRSYGGSRQKLADKWKSTKPFLEKAYFNSQAPSTFDCAICERQEDKILFCPDCGPMAYYCEPCVERVHKIANLHIPLKWDGQTYIPYTWYKELRVPNHQCLQATIPTSFFLIDESGREHTAMVHCCQCMTKAETLIMLGFWPASPHTPKTAIHLRFMEKARSFLLEGTLALQKFCASTKEYLLSVPTYGFEVDLYRILSRDCATQHRSFAYDIAHLKEVVEDYPDSTECPVCAQTGNVLPKIVSMDGNFRLVRKKSSGKSYAKPHHASRLFIEKEEFQPFLSKDKGMSSTHDVTCNDFKAGDMKRSAFRASKLDVTGVFGSVCVHDYPQKLMDLEAGEKIGYSVCLINQWKDSPAGLKVTYDIACRIKPQLQRSGIDMRKISLAVPVFHLYAHKMRCMIDYNPRLLELFRNTDGENIERMWSYLGQFTYITKEMTASNRRDLLVDALLHYGKRAIRDGGKRLAARLDNAWTEKGKAVTQQSEAKIALAAGGREVTDEVIQTWDTQYKAHMEDVPTGTENPWEESYVTTLNTFYSLSLKLVEPPLQNEEIERKATVQKLEEKLKDVEKSHKFRRWKPGSALYKSHLKAVQDRTKQDLLKKLHREAVERQYYILVKRGARGYDEAAKVSKKLKGTNSTLQKLVTQYNSHPDVNPLTFDVAKDIESPLYDGMVTNIDGPFRLVREVVVASNRIRRCDEEIDAIKIELPALLDHHKATHQLLEEALNEEDLSPGAKSCVFKRLCENEKEQMMTLQEIRKALPDHHKYVAENGFLIQLQESINALSQPPVPAEADESSSSDSDEDDPVEDDDDAMASSDEEYENKYIR